MGGMSMVVVAVVVLTALIFDFTNGFHDSANAMATSIATGALKPRVAVAISAVLNMVGAFLSVQVARTISAGLVNESRIAPAIIFGGLVGAVIWNLLTWLLGLPSSSSHALFGGLIGATWVSAGANAVHFTTVLDKIIVPALASPIIAGVIAGVATYSAYRITRRTDRTLQARGYRAGQIFSASLVSLAHGTNDAQKTMGVITLTLITAGILPAKSSPPIWVIASAGLAIALGTYTGGWRIIRTVGRRITDVETPQGFAAETSAATIVLASSYVGAPLSTTQVCSGAVMGAGVGKRGGVVHWRVVGRMVLAWVCTLPAAAVVGALAGRLAGTGTTGTVAVAALGIAVAGGIYWLSRRQPVTAANVNTVPAPAPATP
jgi:inorganic phosphate transporter, PiT family